MVQVRRNVGTAQNGSMKAVSGSGMASMSEASMLFQPRMVEPSKPKPSAKTSSVNSPMGQLKCCQVPKVSTNLMSTILAPLFFANLNYALGCAHVVFLISAQGCTSQSIIAFARNRSGNYDLNGLFAGFFRADADRRFRWRLTKTLPSPILPVLAALTIASTAAVDLAIGDDDFDFYFRQKIHGVFAAAVNFGVALLAAKTFYLGNRHSLDAQFRPALLSLLPI